MKSPAFARSLLVVILCLAGTSPLLAQTTFPGGSIIINDGTTATPYPSTILVSGLTGTITDVNVTISNITHNFPDDIGLLLVSPTGVAVRLMTDAGGGLVQGFSNITLTFDDAALTPVPDEGPVPSGSYQPTQGTQDLLSGPHPPSFSAPAPASPYNNTLASLNGTDPLGTWSLFVDDDTTIDGGTIGGWSLTINSAIPEPSTWMLLGVGTLVVVMARRRGV